MSPSGWCRALAPCWLGGLLAGSHAAPSRRRAAPTHPPPQLSPLTCRSRYPAPPPLSAGTWRTRLRAWSKREAALAPAGPSAPARPRRAGPGLRRGGGSRAADRRAPPRHPPTLCTLLPQHFNQPIHRYPCQPVSTRHSGGGGGAAEARRCTPAAPTPSLRRPPPLEKHVTIQPNNHGYSCAARRGWRTGRLPSFAREGRRATPAARAVATPLDQFKTRTSNLLALAVGSPPPPFVAHIYRGPQPAVPVPRPPTDAACVSGRLARGAPRSAASASCVSCP